MKKIITLIFLIIPLLPAISQQVPAQLTEVIYGRKDGMALTMQIQPPSVASNNRAVIWVVSAG